ncbi:MAG: pyridoxal-phosphate dependent enzyme [Chloroflexi bacterium]|nr:MAG: pyridoxal-phosphate dependent enzyme [Chloroflexota bacterium]
MIHPDTISQAATRLAGVVNKTPVMTSRTLNGRTGRELFLKCENFQRVGAFKFRGAYNAISQLTPEQKAAGVITHSSGNHAQGVALAARLLGVPAVIVMPEDAPTIKKEATAAYGAKIVSCAAIDREKVAADLVAQHGYTLIHPYDNEHIIAGQGTAAWELFAEVGPLDTLFVPVGGGGLISGCALAAAAASPGCRVVGVEPALAADANQSWRENRIIELDHVPATIADGLRTRFIGTRNLDIMRQYVHDMVTVSEEAILATLYFLWTRMKLVVEPSAAVALAPLFTGSYTQAGQRVGVILSGGNVDVIELGRLLAKWQAETAVSATPSAASPSSLSPSSQPDATPAPASDQKRILVCEAISDEAMNILQQAADIVDFQPNLSPEALINQISNYHALIVGPKTHVNEVVVGYGYNLRVIGCAHSRLDNVDVSAAKALGIEVVNAPNSRTVVIAEHTMSRLLMLASKFGNGHLAGKTLGIIGFGRIGREVAKRAKAFNMRVIVNQPRLTPELALAEGVEAKDLLDLLAEADFVTLHVPFRADTETIIGATELACMKPTACLVNAGHTNLVDEAALLTALENNRLAGAALSDYPKIPGNGDVPELSVRLRQHPHVITAPHVTHLLGDWKREADVHVARQVARILQTASTQETLSLEIVPSELVIPHEQIDEKRVARLMKRLEEDGRLVNPPITIFWNGRYIVLDGATRSTALKRLGYPYTIVQVVRPGQDTFELHTWYHAISSKRPFSELLNLLQQIPGLQLTPIETHQAQTALRQPDTLCYFLDRNGNTTLATIQPGANRLQVMNELVATYTNWGDVERTLLTDLPRLLAQFPQMTAVAIFPQFKPETVFEVASQGELLPAGLTRFVIPGRILRLNADLKRLHQDEPLAAKRAWFNRFLQEKLARSRLRYYQEPVILLDE